VILTSAVVLAVALTVPALGQSTDWFGLASQANERSEHALKRAKNAKKKARKANRKAKKASQLSEQLQQDLAGTKIVSDQDPGTVNTASNTYVDLGGPAVNVNVPESGLIDVWAQIDVEDNNDGGGVALFEDGQLVPGQAPLCDPDVPTALLLWEGTGGGGPITIGTPSATIGAGNGCGTLGPPGPVQFERPPGTHTYELRYVDPCPCGSSQFSNRVVRVGPRL